MRPLALVCAALLPLAGVRAEFRAGAFAQDISPTKFPSPVNGSMKGGFAESIHDPMHARCLAVSDGSHEIVFCVLDACLCPREIMEAAKKIAAQKTGVPAAQFCISATHTHSAATMTAVFQSDPDPPYVAGLPERIAQGLIKAHENLEPAEIGWASADNPDQVFNRRWFVKEGESYENPFGVKTDRVRMNPGYQSPMVTKPSGPVDPQVSVLAVRSGRDRRPLALFANYSLHYVGGNPSISADYYGAFAHEVARRLKTDDARYDGRPKFVGIMSNGTSGNINNVNFGAPAPGRLRPGLRIEEVASSVATTAVQAYDAIQWRREARLGSVEEDIQLGVRKATAGELATARAVMESVPKDKDGQWSVAKAIYAREAVKLADYPDQVPVKLQAHRIGDLTIAAIPCEVFVEIGLDLKQSKPRRDHFTISLANGYNGYLPTRQHHEWGGYETWRARSSYLEVGAAEKITVRLKAMLAKLGE
jgi:neutral ceramidase